MPAKSASTRPAFRDGDFATTADQAPLTYEVELADIMATITVADWETPTTQTIDIGA